MIAGIGLAIFVAGTLLALILVIRLVLRVDTPPAEPPDGSGDDWETFEEQFAEYVASGAGRRRRPAGAGRRRRFIAGR
jgi:hypothetical protein